LNDNQNHTRPIFKKIGLLREASLTRLLSYYVLMIIGLILFRQLSAEYLNYFNMDGFDQVSKLMMDGLNLDTQRDDVYSTIIHIFATLIYTLPVAWVYRITKSQREYDESLAQSIIVIAIIVTGIMMMLGESLARAFGMVAILSAVRYRVAVKDTKDAVYIFLSMAIGMANGLGVPHLGLTLSVLVNIVFLVLWRWKIGKAVVYDSNKLLKTDLSDCDKYIESVNVSQKKKRNVLTADKLVSDRSNLLMNKTLNAVSQKKYDSILSISLLSDADYQNDIESVLTEMCVSSELNRISANEFYVTRFEYLIKIKPGFSQSTLLRKIKKLISPDSAAVEYDSLLSIKKKIKRKIKKEKDIQKKQSSANIGGTDND